MQGSVILENKNVKRSNPLNVSALTKGIYFVQIKSEKNTLVKKVVIE
ncbi:MAG: T9SS type A sorting domain-containing protein [Bacteroidetes bacterium]|nr:T9SS type A sorting domain-containing protein [Bacteroidota bacterium]